MTSSYSIPSLISVLEDDVIKDSHITALRHAGMYTIEKITESEAETISKILECDIEFATQVLSKAYSKLPSTWFQTSQELRSSGHKSIKISTGSDSINELLQGGVALGEIVELFGESGSGKTQTCLTMSIAVQQGLDGKAIFIDTRRCLRTERLLEIAKARDLKDYKKTLDNVLVIQPRTSDQLIDTLEKAKEHLKTNWIPLLMVDSVTGLLRIEYPLNSDIDLRQRKLSTIMAKLRDIAEEFLIGVVVTNSCYTSFSFPFSQVPYGGAVMESGSTTRLHMSKSNNDSLRHCKIHQSAHLPPKSCDFIIGSGGIL